MPNVVVAGPASWNTLVDLAELPRPVPQTVFARAHRRGLGGTSAGKALTLARLGVHVSLRTAVGDDDIAEHIRTALHHPLLDLHAAVGPGSSEQHLNLMAGDGSRLSIYLDLPPDPGPAPVEVRTAVERADVLVADLADHVRELLPLARGAGVEVWCDVHDYDGRAEFHRDFVTSADVLLLSGDRLDDPAGYLARRVSAGTRWAVCTLGADGALALGRDEGWVEVPAVPAEVRDTNGAGDAFAAGMLLGHLRGLGLAECLRLGAAAGSLAVATADLVADVDATAVHRLAGLT